jgi:hypothetical protein
VESTPWGVDLLTYFHEDLIFLISSRVSDKMAMFLRKEKNSVRATEVKRGKREMRPSRLLSSRFNSKRALLSSTMTPYQELRGVGVFQLVSCFLRTNRDRVMRSGSSRTHTNIAHQDKKISLGGCVVCPLERIIDSSQLAPTGRYETHSNTNKQQQQALVSDLQDLDDEQAEIVSPAL